jgi:hypothetical protein
VGSYFLTSHTRQKKYSGIETDTEAMAAIFGNKFNGNG